MSNRLLLAFVLGVIAAAVPQAQAPGRIATSPGALLASPVFFHGRQIVIRAAVSESNGLTQVDMSGSAAAAAATSTPRAIYVLWKDRPSRPEGEIRGEFWDLGRLRPDDGRFSGVDFKPIVDAASGGTWPGRDEVFVILGATLVEAPAPTSPSVRAIVMDPDRFDARGVTVVGRFRGRNLYGDLPTALNRTKWDFVLQSADAAIWVSNIRPRGKGFDLDPGARVDTGRWLEVTGTVRREGSRIWIEGESMQLTTAPAETPVEIVVPPTPREPPPQVIFSAPVQDETDVEPAATVRIQFSRDMDPRSFRDHVRVTYAAPAQGLPPAPPSFTATYDTRGNRALEIKFAKPLDRFQLVKVELLEGIAGADGQALPPWTLTFTTGS